MKLQMKHLRMRAQTSAGLYGADIRFKPGLNVIWADNTKGKSACVQGMLYALGLEKMLSPRREVPLPHAMTSYLDNDDDTSIPILESYVALEIQNQAGKVVTIRRPVKSPKLDNRLVTVDFGPSLTEAGSQVKSRNFFVIDSGSAQREDGFHHFLEDFIGWRLPIVRRYDGPECKLYLETVFPLFWVEQKAGWWALPAAIPTYLRIREIQKRAVEFIMDLDVHKLELERLRIEERVGEVTRLWRSLWEETDRYARRNGASMEVMPKRPTTVTEEINRGYLLVAEGSSWSPLKEILARLKASVANAAALNVPAVSESADNLQSELEKLNTEVEAVSYRRLADYKARQIKDADLASLERRIATLTEDLQKNQDVQKLQRYSGSLDSLTPDRCPTCQQALIDSLLSQEVIAAVMPIEDNIEYIRSQLQMFRDILTREKEEFMKLTLRASQSDRELKELYARIRTVRADLIAPAGNPSAAIIEQRVREEARVRDLEAMQGDFDDAREKMHSLSQDYGALTLALEQLPKDELTSSDQSKFGLLTALLQQRAREFGFSTFEPSDISINIDTYRPQKEGYEIGFETSASDAIRLKWAYQLGLLELSFLKQTNHPGLLLLDEPRQQSSSRASFGRLLERAADRQNEDQQVIISTSEDLITLEEILSRIVCNKKIFKGYVIQPVENA